MPEEIIASKVFTEIDQARFAFLSGDRNPIHVDAIAARRTQAGAPVVHGVHTLLWCLNCLAARRTEMFSIGTLEVKFTKMIYVGEKVEAVLLHMDHQRFEIKASVGTVSVLHLAGKFGLAETPTPLLPEHPTQILRPSTPVELTWEEMGGQTGHVGFAAPAAEIAEEFSSAGQLIGAHRVAAIACCSYLIGMVCPGLHSVLSGMSVTIGTSTYQENSIAFRVTATDSRFRLVRLAFAASGLAGQIDSFARMPPVEQPQISQVARLVARDEFTGATALVVGGSRGLGELTAKLIAAGGGRVVLTYVTGRREAERVRDEIREWGGSCDAVFYDIRQPADEQLRRMPAIVTSLYYFATPFISRRKASFFSETRFAEFLEYYVSGFVRVCEGLLQQRPGGVVAFYPSSVFVDSRPADMTEYAMAKSAGEILCADMCAHLPSFQVSVQRLPRLLTDQTATLIRTKMSNACEVMLPIVRDVEARAACSSQS